MKQLILRFVWGIVAVGIYLTLLGLLIVYFNHHTQMPAKHYVKEDTHRIQVAISPAVQQSSPVKKKKTEPKKERHKAASKRVDHKKKSKKIVKEKITKKHKLKRDRNITKPRKTSKDLFAHVKAKRKKPLIQITDKPVKMKSGKHLFDMVDAKPVKHTRSGTSRKHQKAMDTGIKNAYLAKVQEMLEDWPAQSDFAGEEVKVYLKIDPTGHFEFELKQRSENPEFNRALTAYLKQLQTFGFGPHKGRRTYLFEADFVAKE